MVSSIVLVVPLIMFRMIKEDMIRSFSVENVRFIYLWSGFEAGEFVNRHLKGRGPS